MLSISFASSVIFSYSMTDDSGDPCFERRRCAEAGVCFPGVQTYILRHIIYVLLWYLRLDTLADIYLNLCEYLVIIHCLSLVAVLSSV